MSPSSKLVSNNSRTFLKVAIALVFSSKLQQEKGLTTTRRRASFLNSIFRAIATATSPQAPSTKSAVVESRRRRILSSLKDTAVVPWFEESLQAGKQQLSPSAFLIRYRQMKLLTKVFRCFGQ